MNQKDLDNLQQLGLLFDVFKDPIAAKKLIDDLNKATVENQKATAMYKTVEAFDAAVAAEKLNLAKFRDKIIADKADFEVEVVKRTSAADARDSSLDEDFEKLSVAKTEYVKLLDEVNTREKTLASSEARFKQQLDDFTKRDIVLTQREVEVTALRDRLNAAIEAV